jgi:hypothetical protein
MANGHSVVVTPLKGYRWGRFQGWSIFIIGLSLFLVAPFMRSAVALLGGSFLMIEGVGLVGKRTYGLVLFYIQIILTYAAGYEIPPHPEAEVMRWVFLAFLVIPGSFYYPRRWNDFR